MPRARKCDCNLFTCFTCNNRHRNNKHRYKYGRAVGPPDKLIGGNDYGEITVVGRIKEADLETRMVEKFKQKGWD